MSEKIPLLEMFSALRRYTELAVAVEGWYISSATISKAQRSAEITVEGARGAGANLIEELQQAICRSYMLSSVKIAVDDKCAPTPDRIQEEPAAEDVFARTEAMRAAAMQSIPKVSSAADKPKEKKPDVIYGKVIRNKPMPIGSLDPDSGQVVIEGDVFAVEHKELKKRNAWVIGFDVTDYTGSIHISKFMAQGEASGGRFSRGGDDPTPIVNGVKKGQRLIIQGRLRPDNFYGDLVLEPTSIMLGTKQARTDDCEEKRVELHLHTDMSAMDALTNVSPKKGPDINVVRRAESWGHKAIAITDHGVAQSFPHANDSAKNIKILYGVEAYYINDVHDRVAVHGDMDQTLDGEVVCFDLETTGLSRKKDVIIEIGAVVLRDGQVTETFNTFVSPGRYLTPEITQLTGINDAMLKGAPSQEEALRAFLKFAGDRPLVAHNADFDVGFVAAGCARYGIEFVPTYVDTLVLAQNLLPELGKYKLDMVADHLQLPAFNHHRASDDAATAALILAKLNEQLKGMGVQSLQQINPAMLPLRQATANRGKRHPKHLIILAKNQMGLRNLYKLISLSHLEHFKRYPIMPKSLIDANREGLIIGSACEAGELFGALVDGKEYGELKRIAEWYDYLEIQPICNNMFMLRKGIVDSEEELRDFNRVIVQLGKELDKPVCATGDVHFLDPEDEIYRHILLASKGFEDADSELPIYFKTTGEMLEEFAYLGEETAREVVVTNTNLIADWCDHIEPLPKGLFAPKLEDSDGELKRLVWGKAHDLYGEEPPQLVVDRINAELDDIIRCKYDVIYMSAQKLVQNSLEHGYLVGSRGSVGSSLVAFMSGITEVNSLPAHYRCPNCKHSDFDYAQDPEHPYGCGADMPDAVCPKCGTPYEKDGFNIPFETFLGFGGDKVPDIDLNFSGEYQASAHRYTFELFGQTHVFRAGTVGTVAEKTAFGYVKKYLEERLRTANKAEMYRLAVGCTGVKRTTGQHPGGMVVIPQDKEIYDFCPVQHPADDPDSDIITTHFEYHSMESNLLKLDMLGHDDPSMIRMLQDLTGVDPQKIPLDDRDTMSIFKSSKALGYEDDPVLGPTGGTAIPEFGTTFVRGMLEDTQPDQFDILVRLSGFSHGTDVWLGNAKDLITSGTAKVSQAIGCRDDIMLFLISKGMQPKRAFKIMEAVRKGRGLPEGAEDEMKALDVPEWYIGSCKKIAYLFPKAHAVAYVMMAFRIAWFKVHRPLAFYAAYFSIRAKAFDEAFMCRGMDVVKRKMREITLKENPSAVEQDMLTTLEVCYEFYLRGFRFEHMDVYQSHAVNFLMDEEQGTLTPPFVSVAGLGETAAWSLQEQCRGKQFISIEEVSAACPKVSKTHIDLLKAAGAFGSMPDSSQMDLFSMF